MESTHQRCPGSNWRRLLTAFGTKWNANEKNEITSNWKGIKCVPIGTSPGNNWTKPGPYSGNKNNISESDNICYWRSGPTSIITIILYPGPKSEISKKQRRKTSLRWSVSNKKWSICCTNIRPISVMSVLRALWH